MVVARHVWMCSLSSTHSRSWKNKQNSPCYVCSTRSRILSQNVIFISTYSENVKPHEKGKQEDSAQQTKCWDKPRVGCFLDWGSLPVVRGTFSWVTDTYMNYTKHMHVKTKLNDMHVSVKVHVCAWRMYVFEWNYMDVKDKYESIWKGQIVLYVFFNWEC